MQKIQISFGNHFLYPTISKFPGGEMMVKCKPYSGFDECRIDAVLTSSDDVMALVMVTDSLREQGFTKIRLTMPYVPYARQDRVCNPGEALSIRAFAKIINSLNFASVAIYDPHSDVTTALIDRCIAVKSVQLLAKHEQVGEWIYQEHRKGTPLYLVSPDAGSVKKTYEIAKNFPQFKGIIFAEKVRDVVTGNIIRTSVGQLPDDFCNAKLLVCDDICDGGRTFTELGKVLQQYNPKEMNLYVTHGIFSQGKEVLLNKKSEPEHEIGSYFVEHTGMFDNVWSTIAFNDYQ